MPAPAAPVRRGSWRAGAGTGARRWPWPTFSINGRRAPLDGVPPHTTLLDFVRAEGLTGCKEGCAEGECGACSVLVARPGVDSATEWVAINACLVPAAALDGQEVVTAEGLGRPDALHPVQHEMAVRGGSQCGYCTPGFVCSMAAEYYRPGRAGDRSTRHSDARARAERLRPARAERQPVPLHRLPADPRRGLRPATSRPPTTRSPPAARQPPPPPGRHRAQRRGPDVRAPAVAAGRAAPAARPAGRGRRRRQHRLGRRGQPARPPGRLRHRHRPAERAARTARRATTPSRSAPRSP